MRKFIKVILLISVLIICGNNNAQSKKSKFDTIIYNKIESVEKSVNFLESQNDSLSKKLDYVKNNDYKSFEVIDKVNDFYENAWIKLIYLISAIGGIVVFVIPYILSRLQKRELRLNIEKFEESVDSKIKEELNKIRIEIQNLNRDINKTQKEDIAKVYAMTYYLQGRHSIQEGNHDLTIKSFIISIGKLLTTNTDANLKLSLKFIISALDEKINAEEKLTENVDKELNEMIVKINEIFPNSFDDEISELKEKITTANNA